MAGLAAVFVPLGMAFGSVGESFAEHRRLIEGVVGAITIFVGCLFAGLFEALPFGSRQIKISAQPKYGLAGAPFVGALVGLGWSPCIGPTLAAVLGLAAAADGASASRGGMLAFAYCIGLGIPFLIFGLAYQRALGIRSLLQRHSRTIMRVGGFSLIALGLLQVLGLWTDVIVWVQTALPTPTLPI
jgi:cytochrome c-type biogenesis protein